MNQSYTPDEVRAISAEHTRHAIMAARMINPAVVPVYTGPSTGYLGTGFTLEEVCAMGVDETHPAIMRYLAYKGFVRRAYPKRGSRPPGTRQRLMGLAGNAAQVRHMLSPAAQAAYTQRTLARMTGKPVEEFPRAPIAHGRSATAIAASQPRYAALPPCNWGEQAFDDLRVLIELGHKIPFSQWPTQTRMRKDYALESVPLDIAYHSHRSCSGRYGHGSRCKHCLRDGKPHTSRPMTAGYSNHPQLAPNLPHYLRPKTSQTLDTQPDT